MKYKLLVLDVDGTLLDSEKKISKRTLAALLKVQQMGVRIVLASGRPTYGLMPIHCQGSGTGQLRRLHPLLQWRANYQCSKWRTTL